MVHHSHRSCTAGWEQRSGFSARIYNTGEIATLTVSIVIALVSSVGLGIVDNVHGAFLEVEERALPRPVTNWNVVLWHDFGPAQSKRCCVGGVVFLGDNELIVKDGIPLDVGHEAGESVETIGTVRVHVDDIGTTLERHNVSEEPLS